MRVPGLAADSLLRNREFGLYIAGGWLSASGTWIQNIVAAVVMLRLTDSVLMVGVLNFASFLPLLLFSLVGGVASDSLRRRDIVVISHGISAVLAGLLAVLTLSGRLEPWHLIVVAFLINTTYAFAKPALTSMIPLLVPRERIPQASAFTSMQFTGGQIVGSAIASISLAVGAPGVGFAVNALTYLGPIVAMLRIPAAGRLIEGRPSEGSWRALLEGLDYVRRDPIVFLLIIGIMASSVTAEAMRTLSPVFATRVLQSDDSVTGVIIGAFAIGSGLALLSISWLLRYTKPSRLSILGIGMQGAGAFVFAVAPTIPIAIGGAALIGVGLSYNLPMLTARLIEHAPDRMRGRVTSLHTLSNLGSRPLAAITAATVATLVGPRFAMGLFVIAAGVGLLAAVTSGRRQAAASDAEARLQA